APSKTITNTAGGTVSYTVRFSDSEFAFSSLSAANVHLVTTGTATGTVSVDTGNGPTRTVTVTPTGRGNGTLAIAIDAGSATDQAGNTALASGNSTPFTLDNVLPSISISAPTRAFANTAAGPVSYTVTYTDLDN